MKIAQLGQPVLRQVAEPVPPEALDSPAFRELIEAMVQTLEEAGGVGLAAPQVFVSQRLFLACINPPREEGVREVEVFINPRLTERSVEREPGWEGCLSFPELQVLVPRHRRIALEFLDLAGRQRTLQLEGFPARIIQHEYDHLEGILTLDRAASTRDIVKASEMEAVLSERGEIGDIPSE